MGTQARGQSYILRPGFQVRDISLVWVCELEDLAFPPMLAFEMICANQEAWRAAS